MKKFTVSTLAVIVICVLSASSSEAKDLVIDATNYEESFNIGSLAIGVAPMGFLQGMDMPGEWTKYTFSTTESIPRGTSILIRGTDGVDFHLQLKIEPDGIVEIQTFDFYFTGAGFG